MKKAVAAGIFLALSLAVSSGYSQDITTAEHPTPVPENTPGKRTSLGEKIGLSFSVQGEKTSGYAGYHTQYSDSVWHWEGTSWVKYLVPGQNVSAFPVDGFRIEVLANSRLRLSTKRAVMLELCFSTIVTQPSQAMVDSDYVDLSSLGSFSNWVNGATQSSVEYSNYDISATAGFPLFSGSPWELIPTAGFHTSSNRFDVVGLAGWFNYYGDRYNIDSAYYAGMNVMDYEVTYNRITLGARLKTADQARIGFALEAVYFPWVKASDRCKDLLSFMESSTDAKGNGYSIGGKMSLLFHTARNGSTWSAGAGYGMLRVTATGSQIQKYYADSPDYSYDETGLQSAPIANTLKLRQNGLVLFLEYKLGGKPGSRGSRAEFNGLIGKPSQGNGPQNADSSLEAGFLNSAGGTKEKADSQGAAIPAIPASPKAVEDAGSQNISQGAEKPTAPGHQSTIGAEEQGSEPRGTAAVKAVADVQPAVKSNPNPKWQCSVNFTGKKVSGYTEYHTTYPIVYYVYPGEGNSILAFPTDGYKVEAAGTITARLTKRDVMVFELAAGKSITTPKEAMVDSDNIYISFFAPPTWVYSATKSDVKYSDYDLRFTAGYPLWLNKQLKMTPVIGFQTSHKSFDVIGLSGWWEYYYMDKIPIVPEDYAGVKVGTYKVDYHQMITGLIFETVPNKGLSFYLKGIYYPYVKAGDHDDHILRLKESTTEASGRGYQIEGRIKIQARQYASGAMISWGGGYNMFRITAKGPQIQKYYADSPDFPYDETGMESNPIDNTLKLRENSFLVFIEYKP